MENYANVILLTAIVHHITSSGGVVHPLGDADVVVIFVIEEVEVQHIVLRNVGDPMLLDSVIGKVSFTI